MKFRKRKKDFSKGFKAGFTSGGIVPTPNVNFAVTNSTQMIQQWTNALNSLNAGAASMTRALAATYAAYPSGNAVSRGKPITMIPDLDLPLSFSAEPIIAWRAWQIADYQRRGGVSEKWLKAWAGGSVCWKPRERNEAFCNSGGHHESPWSSCQCGFWAFRSPRHLWAALGINAPNEGYFIWGRVSLWGRVLETANGYRAQYAYPLSLTGPDVNAVAEVMERYGVEYEKEPTPVLCGIAEVEDQHMDYARNMRVYRIRFSCGAKRLIAFQPHELEKLHRFPVEQFRCTEHSA